MDPGKDLRQIRFRRKFFNRLKGATRSSRAISSIVITYEGHIITTNPLLSRYVVKITKMWRKLGAWYWLATQNLEDFPADAKRMLNMMEWRLCLVMPKEEVDNIARFRELTDEPGRLLLDAKRGLGKPETFDFLGFTLICGRSRFGNFVIRRKTRRDRLRAKLKEIKRELRRRRYQSIPEQGRWLGQVVRGYFAYHAVPTNGRVLGTFLHHIQRLWVKSLRRRSQKDRFEWRRAPKLVDDWLAKPRILHPWPQDRFAARYSK